MATLVQTKFFLLWTSTLIVALFVSIAVGLGRRPSALKSPRLQAKQWGRREWLQTATLVGYLSCYLIAILYGDDVAWLDQWSLTDYSLRGKTYPVQILPEGGRFFPLHLQEFNYIQNISRDPAILHLIVFAEFVAFLLVFYFLLAEQSFLIRICAIVAVTMLPGIFVPYSGFVYPERNLVFFLGAIALFLRNFSLHKDWINLAGLTISTQFFLYYKEPAFLLILGIAVSRLYWSWMHKPDGERLGFAALCATHIAEIVMVALSCVYLALLFAAVGSPGDSGYVDSQSSGSMSALATYISTNPLLVVFSMTFGLRMWKVLTGKIQPDHLWDSLAVGASVYAASIISLGLYASYYLAPVDFVALAYIARFIGGYLKDWTPARRVVVTTLAIGSLGISMTYSAFLWFERKSSINAFVELAALLKTYQSSERDGEIRLLFPYGTSEDETNYALMELYSYLRHKNLPAAPFDQAPSSNDFSIILETSYTNLGNRCVPWHEAGCFGPSMPTSGHLSVRLPTDASSTQAGVVDGRVVTVLSTFNHYSVPDFIRPVFEYFYWAGHSAPMPDHWPATNVYAH